MLSAGGKPFLAGVFEARESRRNRRTLTTAAHALVSGSRQKLLPARMQACVYCQRKARQVMSMDATIQAARINILVWMAAQPAP